MTNIERNPTAPATNLVKFPMTLRGQGVTVQTGISIFTGSWTGAFALLVTCWDAEGKEIDLSLTQVEVATVCLAASEASGEIAHLLSCGHLIPRSAPQQ